MKKPWIAFFSQTGGEIVELSESLGKWPDIIVTNERPTTIRQIHPDLEECERIVTVANRPTAGELEEVLGYYKDPLITLHGWLRIMPPKICDKYEIYNGHPGLITKYPDLKGKDPQVKAFEGIKKGKYEYAGAVLHEVTAGVDEGRVIAEERFNASQLELDGLFLKLKDVSLSMWTNFLKNKV